MATIIKEDGTGWYKINTGHNFGERRARKFMLNELNKRAIVRSLVAQHWKVECAKHAVKCIEHAATKKYDLLTFNGYIKVVLRFGEVEA